MTEAQIKLYAALRVSVPLVWGIRGWSDEAAIYTRFSRVVGEPGRRVVSYDLRVPRDALERSPGAAIRFAVNTAQLHVGRER